MITTHPVSLAERAKYAKVWALPDYSRFSPGADAVDWVLAEWPIPWASNPAGKWVLDVGCGAGRAGAKFAAKGCRVTLIDWGLDGCAVPLPEGLPTLDTCLWHDWPPRLGAQADLAYCVDVMEHLPTEFTMAAVRQMLRAARLVFLQIALFNDTFGDKVHETLHLTIQPFHWWRDRLADLGAEVIDARDCLESGSFLLRGNQ